jgi:uncharacterized protein
VPTPPYEAPDDAAGPQRRRLRDALRTAMKSRDRIAVTALRSAIAAIDNAEAVDPPASAAGLAIEHSPVGAGAADVRRRALTAEQVAEIVRGEVAEREAAARDHDRAGRPGDAERLRREAAVLAAYLPPAGGRPAGAGAPGGPVT